MLCLGLSLACALLTPACTTAPPGTERPRAGPTAPIRLTLPALSGPYRIGTTSLHLVDRSRPDPWKPDRRRELMVTISYPARPDESHPRARWLSPALAAGVEEGYSRAPKRLNLSRGTVAWGATERHARVDAPVADHGGPWPVVLFSPGYVMWSELYTVSVDDLASRGYVVVSMAHTYEVPAVEFPGGRVENGINPGKDPVTMKTAIDARVADTRFVLDQLTQLATGANPDAEQRPLPPGLGGALDLSKIGMFGHSYGGYTAGEAMYQDRRIAAGANLDGTMAYELGPVLGVSYQPGEVVKHGLDRPFLLMGASLAPDPGAAGKLIEHNHLPGDPDQSWVDFWPAQRGWKRDLNLPQAAHMSYSDMQTIVPQLGPLVTREKRESIIGTIDPDHSLAAQHDYLDAFFALHLSDRDNHLFTGPAPQYPEVKFVQ